MTEFIVKIEKKRIEHYLNIQNICIPIHVIDTKEKETVYLVKGKYGKNYWTPLRVLTNLNLIDDDVIYTIRKFGTLYKINDVKYVKVFWMGFEKTTDELFEPLKDKYKI